MFCSSRYYKVSKLGAIKHVKIQLKKTRLLCYLKKSYFMQANAYLLTILLRTRR